MRDLDVVLEAGTCHIVDVKARIRGGRSVEVLESLVSVSAGDSIVRTSDAAVLQLIDVKAHVLGGFA